MANTLYSGARQAILGNTLNVASVTIKCLLGNNSYHPNPATDNFVSDVGATHIVSRSSAFTGKSITGGTFVADHVVFAALTGVAVFYIVIYQDTGTDTTARLIALIDTALGLPFTPNGGNVEMAWDPSGIFRV